MKHAIGLDIGATHIRTALGDEKGKLHEFISERTESSGIEQQIYRMLDRYSNYDCIGIGSMGPLNSRTGIITNPPNIKIRNFKVVSIIEKKYGVKCVLLNDAVAGVYGEKRFGAGKKVENLVYVTISTGLGAGVIENNRLVLGKDGNGHEIGHCGVDANIRLKCRCGSYGRHWEAYCAGINIPNFVRHMLTTKYKGKKSRLSKIAITAKEFFSIAREDEVGSMIIEDLGRINASGISNIINAYDPDLITIGGSVALNNHKAILGPIKKHIKEYSINRIPRIIITPLKNEVILAGAIAYALDLEL